MAWSEHSLHRWLARRRTPKRSRIVGSRGHDAAVLRGSSSDASGTTARRVVCTDQTIEGVHFDSAAPPGAVGHKAAARAISDLAATAARPHALLLALSAPKTCDEGWLKRVIGALDRTAHRFGAELVGGDLACAPGPVALSVTALGELTGKRRSPGRDRARAGQVLLVTGPLGGSALGRHLNFQPRVEEGRWLFEQGATAMIDVSDGLALDLSRLAHASGVRIDLDQVPIHRDARRAARASSWSAREHALFDGEDHELVATLPAAAWRRVEALARRPWPALQRIGSVAAGQGLWFEPVVDERARRWDGVGGWLHGS